MSGLGGFIERLSNQLQAAGIEYMLVGSVASIFHGEPRSTQDVDVVVELSVAGLTRLLERLPDDDYYVSAPAARAAVTRRSQFNVIDMESGWKADLIVRKDREFSTTEFGRRVRGTLLGVPVWLASAEDTVITKLEWSSKGGGSERQLRDVAGVLRLRGEELDHEYIDHWCARLGLEAGLREARRQAADGAG